MRSPGVIYRKYRQLKKKLLYDKIISAKQRIHCNCSYGKRLPGDINICLYGLSHEGDLDICTNPWDCNAFALKWTKKKVLEQFNKELSNYKTKHTLYPELCAYEWVLDKNLHNAVKEPKFFGKILVQLIEFLENLLKSSIGNQLKTQENK